MLTPAVAAAVKAAKVSKPLSYLLICAFIANAASFVLPISNPANLVIYGSNMPPLSHWLPQYILPSIFAILATYFMLWFTQRNALREKIETDIPIPTLSRGGKTAIVGILVTAVVLMAASALDMKLGMSTATTSILTSSIVIIHARKNPWIVIKGGAWSVLPLVAGLFVIVEALHKTGVIQTLSTILHQNAPRSVTDTTWISGIITAFACNLMNNLPAGLIAGNLVQEHTPEIIRSAVLIGIDLGPNLSITGSLATILYTHSGLTEGLPCLIC